MRVRWCLAAALAVVLTACGSSPGDGGAGVGNDVAIDVPVATGNSQTIRLAGVVRGSGSVGVVLAHMLGSSQAAWSPIVGDLVDEGFHVLSFDFRGHGLSAGDRDPSKAGLDLSAAVTKLRSLGATKVLVVGASMGGTAAVVVGATEDLAGVVTLSAAAQIDSLDASGAARSLKEPLLVIVGARDDPRYVDAARAINATAPAAPKRLEIVEGSSAHGTNLLVDERSASRVKGLIIDFLTARGG